MKKYVAFTLLGLTVWGVFASHLDVESLDDSHVLVVDGVRWDALGHARNQLNRLTRRCDALAPREQNEAMAPAVTAVLSAYSPPDSRQLHVSQLSSKDTWFLAEVQFPHLQPAVILLEQNATGWSIHHRVIWSGSAAPWVAGPWIRRYLAQRAPQVPSDLWACFEPTPGLFNAS